MVTDWKSLSSNLKGSAAPTYTGHLTQEAGPCRFVSAAGELCGRRSSESP